MSIKFPNALAPVIAFLLLATSASAQTTVKSPDAFLPHKIGEQFTEHYELVSYFQYLAAMSPKTMKLEQYGSTNEDRPLMIAIFSSPENMARLEQIRLNHLRGCGLEPGVYDESVPTAIVWLSMSVHGNEGSGSECSMPLAYKLATQTEANIQEWLKNTVVIVDPSLNPDGFSRYNHWLRGVGNKIPNPDLAGREHLEPWPGGRVNHYYYDLNRDWAWLTQKESQERVAAYQQWVPHVHADLHEQYVDNPYYFAPAAEPMHLYINQWQRDFQNTIGKNHAMYFDQEGWLYFTKEVFDLFYPSYGDTYPMFNGSIGMTYEQAGNSRGGRAAAMSTGDTLTLLDRVQHHLTTSLSTIEISSKNAQALSTNLKNYYQKSINNPAGAYLSYVIKADNDPNRTEALLQLLKRHRIQFGLAGASISNAKGFDYTTGKEGSTSVAADDIILSAYQPHGVLLQVLFDPESTLVDSLTYDITAWALPFAYQLNAFALKQKIEPKKPYTFKKPNEVMLAAKPYAWCIQKKSLADDLFLSHLVQKGVKVRYATKPFDMAELHYEPGALVITRADNKSIDGNLDGLVKEAGNACAVPLNPIFSSWNTGGPNFGSEAMRLVRTPQIALLYGDDVDANAYGHTWHFLEEDLQIQFTALPISSFISGNIARYNTIILPGGSYNFSDETLGKIKEWTQGGGRLIAFDSGAKAFSGKDGFDWKLKAEDTDKDSTENKMPLRYSTHERDGISDTNPGCVIKAKTDSSHPLAFGLKPAFYTLKTNNFAYEMPKTGTPILWTENTVEKFGFVGARLLPKFKNTALVTYQSMGDGSVIYMSDSPIFRGFWYGGKELLANALFF